MPISIANFLKAAFSILSGLESVSASNQLAKIILSAIQWLAQLATDVANTFWWSLARTNWEWNWALHPNFSNAQPVWEAMGRDVYSITKRLIDVIIPASVRAGASITNIRGGGVLVNQVKALTARVTTDEGKIKNLWGWINNIGTPVVKSYNNYYLPPKGTGYQMTEIVQVWVKAPGILSGKLAPSMTGDIVGQLGKKAGSKSLAALFRLLAGYAPQAVKVIDAAAVAVLQSGSY